MKLSWPPWWGQETQMWLRPNLTPAWTSACPLPALTAAVVSGGRDEGTRVPWQLTRGWRFGKSTLTFGVRAAGADSRCLPPLLLSLLRGLSLAEWPCRWPRDTVCVSHVSTVGDGRSAAEHWHQVKQKYREQTQIILSGVSVQDVCV